MKTTGMKTLLRQTTLQLAVLLVLTSAAAAAPLEIFVSIPPQKWLSEKIGGELVSTTVLVARGQDPHTFEPTPRQISSLARSRLYFTIGMEFEQQITHKLDGTVASMRMVDTTATIDRIPAIAHEQEEGHDVHVSHAASGHPEESEKSAGQEEQGRHAHHHSGDDPHVWLSPPNLIRMAKVMAEAMIAADPEHAATYRQNLNQTTDSLTQLHRDIATMLAPFRGASFYVFHPSFGYFAREYGLRQEAVEISGKSPTPKQISNLIAKAKEDKVRIIFVQPQFDSKSATAVARAIGGVVEPLDALAGDIPANLRTMALQIKNALDHAPRTQP